MHFNDLACSALVGQALLEEKEKFFLNRIAELILNEFIPVNNFIILN